MFKARYYKADGKKGPTRALPESVFDGVVNDAVLHQVVKAYLANQRQGTASGKNRAAARGGGRKPWRQKGTGRARQGTIRAPQWVGGGRAFPPIPHSWRERIPKKVKAVARRSAFSARAGDGRVFLVDALQFDEPKTRRLVGYLEEIGADGKVLILTDGVKPNVVLSARNEQSIQVMPFGEESPYHILWASTVLIEESAIEAPEVEGDVEVKPLKQKGAKVEEKEADEGGAKDAKAASKKAAGKKPATKKATAKKATAKKATASKAAAEKKPATKKEAATEKGASKKKPADEAAGEPSSGKAASKKEASAEKSDEPVAEKAAPKKKTASKKTNDPSGGKAASKKEASAKKEAAPKEEAASKKKPRADEEEGKKDA